VNLLLDEMLDAPVADAMNVYTHRHGLTFSSIRSIAAGMGDDDIPNLCKERGMVALVSANTQDFGKKLRLYEALLANGVSVIVMRPSDKRQALTPERQVAIISGNVQAMATRLRDATGPILLKIMQSGTVPYRTIEEILADAESRKKKLP